MKKIVILASVCGLGLIAAAPPSTGNGYPPCSATITDRCIQLYERGVATPANLALNERLGPNDGTQLAMGGPYKPVEPMEYESADYEAATGDEYAGNWSDYDAGADMTEAADISGEEYAANDWEEPEPADEWSGYEDQSGW